MVKVIKGQPYVYEKRWVDGRDHWVCLGRATAEGLDGEEEAKARRERERERRSEDRRIVAALMDEDRRSGEAIDLAISATRAMIEAGGYHRPGRKPWRRRRMAKAKASGRGLRGALAKIEAGRADAVEKEKAFTAAERRACLAEVAIRANEVRDPAEGAALAGKFLDGMKAVDEAEPGATSYKMLIDSFGDPGGRSILNGSLRVGGGPVVDEATRRWIEQKRAELLGPEPGVADSLIVGRILVAYLELAERDHQAASLPADASPLVVDTLDKLRSRAEGRLIRLLKTFNELQRFRPPKPRVRSPLEVMQQQRLAELHGNLERNRLERLEALARS